MSCLKKDDFGQLAENLRHELMVGGLTLSVKIISWPERISIHGGVGRMIPFPTIRSVLSFAEKNGLLLYMDCDNATLVLHS